MLRKIRFPGATEIGPLIPKIAIEYVFPGFGSGRLTRFAALNPATIAPPLCPPLYGSFPSTHTSP
jgi:hypothetical protein